MSCGRPGGKIYWRRQWRKSMRSACSLGFDDHGARPLYPIQRVPPDLAAIYERFAGLYGPFRNQAAVFAHVPAALRHLMSMLLELREAETLPKRVLELAIVTVSKLNECAYCVAHHTPFLVVEGVSPAGVECVLDYRDHPEFDKRDKLVVEYAIAAWEQPNRIPSALFARLRRYFNEAQIVELTLRITLCGFFNKFNDALGIEEEPEAVEQLTAVSACAE
jgi:AhpD family alkylhydroperoxidase